jgi:protein tyrosine phosphatase (PTP) superfamily phosphohydrolase (DUF442 family)
MPELSEIYNFAEVNDKLGTSGQPKAEQFPVVKESGYQVVINLADGTSKRDIPEESELWAELGLDYHHIPVDWGNPTDDDLQQFFTLMEANQSKKIFVHCIANYRVSAFTMLYRVIKQGVPLADASAFKDTVWKPEHAYPIWDAFITHTLKQHEIEE